MNNDSKSSLYITEDDINNKLRIPKTIILKGKLAKWIMIDYTKDSKKGYFNLAKWITQNLTEKKIQEFITNDK